MRYLDKLLLMWICILIIIVSLLAVSDKTPSNQELYNRISKRLDHIEVILRKRNPPIDATDCPGCFNGVKTSMKYNTINNRR